MKETMRQALRDHEKRSKVASRNRTPPRTNRPAAIDIALASSPSPTPGTASGGSSPSSIRRKPIGGGSYSAQSSRIQSPATSPITRKPVAGSGIRRCNSNEDFFGAPPTDYTQVRTITSPLPPPKGSSSTAAGRAGASLPTATTTTTSSGSTGVKEKKVYVPRNGAEFASRTAWEAKEKAYLAQYARRHSFAHQARSASNWKSQRKGWAQMYREAGPSDGEVLGRLARKGWREWQEKRRTEKREEAEREERMRREHQKERDENLMNWLEQSGLGKEEGKALGELAGLSESKEKSVKTAVEDEGTKRRKHCTDEERHHRHHQSSGHCRQNSESNFVTTPARAGNSLYSSRTQRTAYMHDDTKPDDLDILMSKVTDKFSQWGKEFSERAAETKVKKQEERQRKTREALKKTISAPQPAEEDFAVNSENGGGRSSVGSSSNRPSFGSEGNARPLLDVSKTSGSMAKRMAKRKDGFEVPFWPKGKKEKSSAASSAQSSPQRYKYTLPADEEYQRRGTQIGQFIDPELAAAPWNQHVNRSNPFSPNPKNGSSTERGRKGESDSNKSSPSGTFFGKLVPSPTSLFTSNSHHRSQESQRRGSEDSFFGCVGISVKEERAAQHVNDQAHDERQLEGLEFRAPPTPSDGAEPSKFGASAQKGGRTPFDGDDSDDEEDEHVFRDRPKQLQAISRTAGQKSVSPPLRNAQHHPNVSGTVGGRRSVAAELVDQRNHRHHGHTVGEPVDDSRVSWWDPPSPSRPMTSEGENNSENFIPIRLEWGMVSQPKDNGEAERLRFWTDYRNNLRSTRDARDFNQDEGKPF